MSKQQFFVRGTSCKSCEVVIERELVKQADIQSAVVSHNKHSITLETIGGKTYSPEELTSFLEKHGYSISKKDKAKYHQKKPINWKRLGGMTILIVSTYLILDTLGILRFGPSSSEPAGLLGVLIIGLIASVSSCTAVVGGLVTAVASKIAKDQEYMSKAERFRPHLLFNVGRIGGFVALGALTGLIGSAIQLNTTMNGLFVLIVAATMILIGINLLELFPTPVVGMPKWLAHKVHDLAESSDPKAPLLLGALTFFLPCGFTQSMQLFALTTQSPLQSALIMGVFAIGTAPVLLGIGGLTSSASGITLKKITKAAGVIVLVLGISNAFNGLALIGFSPSSYFAKAATIDPTTIVDGKQFLQMEISNSFTYEPDVLTVQEGVPVEWTIFGGEFLGCANTLVMPAFGVNTYIESGLNTISFTPTRTGNFPFSCSMGMIRGTMIVTSSST